MEGYDYRVAFMWKEQVADLGADFLHGTQLNCSIIKLSELII